MGQSALLTRGHSPEREALSPQQAPKRPPWTPSPHHRNPVPTPSERQPRTDPGETENKRQATEFWGGFLFNNR